MDISEEYVQTLQSMGFPDEGLIRRALRLGKNDLSEAVAILTNEHPSSNFDTLEELDVALDVEMRDAPTSGPVYGPAPPPTYDEVVEPEGGRASERSDASVNTQEQTEENDSLEFPVANLYELEGRVFTETWSIPYRREESLGRCLVAATRLAEQGLCDSDQYCKRFLERCMPESFQKLLTAAAVHRWGPEIQEGIYTMLQLLVDLVAASLQHPSVPVDLLNVVSMAFNPETEYHTKNKSRRPDKAFWDDKFGVGQSYAISPPASSYRDPYGWLTNIINRFAEKNGFEYAKDRLAEENLDAVAMGALLAPFGNCAEYLNTKVVQGILAPGMSVAIKYVQDMDDTSLKDKRSGSVCDMLATMKLLCLHMWSSEVKNIDDLRLEVALRMLKSPHFNAKMNSLKEVTKLIEDNSGTKVAKTAIHPDKILDWLVENKVLSIALEGCIDQVQYCDKIKNIVEFLGARLSVDELTKIWRMQIGETNVVIDNIHSIIAAAAVKFNSTQLEHLFILIQKSWQVENDKMRQKLLSLIGKIGREARIVKTTNMVLELLWDLAHLPALPTHLIEQALDEHLAILNDSYTVKEQIKRSYVVKCVDDIKEGTWVLPALKQLLQVSKNIAKYSFHKAEKGILQELNKSYDIIKQVTNSLMKFHQLAAAVALGKDKPLGVETLVDGRYNHKDYVTAHLSFLQFILQEGALYLPWHRSRDLWDTLAANPNASDWDRETCFDWFTKGISDLEQDTQSQLFTKELLRLDPSKLSQKGFKCFKCFFENVNQYEHKLKRSGMIVEKLDLVGLDYLWEVCLNTPDTEIAQMGIDLLMTMSYSNLSQRLKRDPVSLHKKFIDECYSRLEAAVIPLGGSALAQVLSSATTIVTAPIMPEVANLPSPSRSANLLSIERLLLIAERYVLTVEELHTTPRTILPHGASFVGHPLSLYITCESPKTDFNIKAHSNETVGSVRVKIANKLKHSADQIQIVLNDKMLSPGKDQKLLHQLFVEDNQVLSVRAFSSSVSGSQTSQIKEIQDSLSLEEDSTGTPTAKQSFDLEQEKMLPGVVMAGGGQVFDMLYRLADLDEPKITSRARSLLKLIPTDPSVQDALDSLGQKVLRQPAPEEASPRVSPRSSPRKFTPSPTPPPSQAPKNPRDAMKNLFEATATDMTSFRVLYNLEVLSSHLMPTIRDPGTLQSAKSFCEDFLNAGGLGFVVNILQKDAIPPDVDYDTRQGCYAIALQLLRFLLCGQEVIMDSLSSHGRRTSSSSAGHSAGAGASMGSGSGPPSLEFSMTPSAASRAIQTLTVSDFTDMVACFMRVSWAAAAGKLHLSGSTHPIREGGSNITMTGSMTGSFYSSSSSRSRQSSTGSTASSNSDTELTFLHAGVCVRQSQVSAKDTYIAKEALELLVTCLQIRSQLLGAFYELPCVSDFIIDILVGSTQSEIRQMALEQFYLLSQTDLNSVETSSDQVSPHQFMLQTLLKARLPFWVSSSNTRGASFRLLQQCTQYFYLRCQLLGYLTEREQQNLSVNINSMLEDEVGWLTNFVPSENIEIRDTDNTLLAGHLRLIKTLLTCEGVNKREYGQSLVQELLHDFLFPASRLIMEDCGSQDIDNSMLNFSPKCSTSDSRVAAYDVLTELAGSCLDNLQELSTELITMHHQTNPEAAHEWEFMPPVDGRSSAGYVGLKNGGATCYMNSVIQQLYMVPGIVEALLSIIKEEHGEDGVYYQIQNVFGHLLESKLQYYVPEQFWKIFKLWGQTVNIREQQDAFDFFQALTDQIDEQLKVKIDEQLKTLGKEEIFKKKFQGIFSDQKICKDCPHRYEREEVFFALNVTVKNATLQDSLAQFVKGELLDGDNAYFCEKCGEKRDTVKRMCIKTLPHVLCIQLKRFGYDWEANRALKFDDHFKFPWVLDMEPYTAEGMARAEDMAQEDMGDGGLDLGGGGDTGGGKEVKFFIEPVPVSQINYELVGVVVHSGQANAGHYYSFIKDRRGTHMTNSNKGRWYKFNDTFIEEFDMTDAAMEAECFGGSYKAKVYDTSSSYPEERLRYWNGYLLFYERMEEARTPVSAKKSRMALKKSQQERNSVTRNSDSLVELTELVHKGEKKGLFTDRMPVRIQQTVRDENLRFMKNRDVYNSDYFRFICNLITKNVRQDSELEQNADIYLASLQLTIKFLFNTYFRTKRKLRKDLTEWVDLVEMMVQRCRDACHWLIDFLGTEKGRIYIKPFLLECPSLEIRSAFAKILERTMTSFFHHGGVATYKTFDELVETMLGMLKQDVPDHVKTCTQYFRVLHSYVLMGTKACSHMFGRNAFQRLVQFLMGPTTGTPVTETESTLRRWSSIQSRDFSHLHGTVAILILNCDISSFRTTEPGTFPIQMPTTVTPQIQLKMSQKMQNFVFGAESTRYIREVVLALREVTDSMAAVEDMLVYCSFCNLHFTVHLLTNIMLQYASAPSNELKALFGLLMQLLLLEDPLQMQRLQYIIDGYTEDNTEYEGMLAVIKTNHMNDSRRSYQCIKFLVNLANRSTRAKDYLVQASTKWQWAVNWLKKKMTEYYWSPQSTSVTSNEDSNSRSFQRTISAQDTLAEATALLTELEAQETSDMETNGDTPPAEESSLPGTQMSSSSTLEADDESGDTTVMRF